MSSWLAPLRLALDRAVPPVCVDPSVRPVPPERPVRPVPPVRPVRFFFRDDDVGWADERLWPLLDRFEGVGLPLDLAVIPAALTGELAGSLRRRIAGSGGLLAAHQHGYRHANHERRGRKHEFGTARPAGRQLRDIDIGRGLLAGALGPTPPIFTPPWNRCTPATGRCALELGFRVLSMDLTAAPLEIPGLVELPVTVDWLARSKGVRLQRPRLGQLLAEAAVGPGPVGVMLHHALCDDHELAAIGELLELVAGHPAATASPMLEAAGGG